MRVFFAIEFEMQIKDYLKEMQDEVRKFCKAGNFTMKDNFHLTLRFIGEQSQNQTEQLQKVLKATAASIPAFTISLGRTGKFDKGNRKIIWLGLNKSPELSALYDALTANLLKVGYQKENRNYNPHITLAREVKSDSLSELESISAGEMAIHVKTISLMESIRIDNKLCYVPLCREDLQ